MNYTKVSPAHIDHHWPYIRDWVDISRGADHSYSLDDIRALVQSGRADLWVILEGLEYKGFFIGMTLPAPQGKIYYGAWLGGKDLSSWVNGLKPIESWARDAGYIATCFIGRKAWKRLVGYDYEGVYYYKNLKQ